MLLLEYKCICGNMWHDLWDCEVDGECPKCSAIMTVSDSLDLSNGIQDLVS